MKHEKVDWSTWPEPPEKDLYDDWITARKSKKHPALTQTAINKYGKHITRLVNDDICSVKMAVEFATEGGWRAIMYKYVVSALNREMDNYSYHEPVRDTRSMTLEQELSSDAWAIGIEAPKEI